MAQRKAKQMTRKYFGTDGIRGQANSFPMTPEVAMKVGMAVGHIFRRKGQTSRVVIGKDTRRSGYMLENALVAGFTAAGMDVFLLGPIPTPAVAMLCRSLRADVGIALDGDADRVLLVDENGTVIDGDQLMAVIAESWAASDRLEGGGIVATVMSNLGLERFLADRHLTLARTKVGDRYVVEHMREHGFNVGGEQSGHIVLSDYATTGDGLISALQILAVAQEQGKPISEICRKFDPVPQLLKNVRTSGGKPLENKRVKSAIDEATERLGVQGRLVIRPSGTEPLIRVMAEGDDRGLVEKVVNDIIDVISSEGSAAA